MTGEHILEYKALKVSIPTFVMEITTGVGCVVACKFCPQKTFLKAYKSNMRKLTLRNFENIIDKIPNSVVIVFSGFAEPFLNDDCAKMILYASRKGHPVSVFTTGTGMSMKDLHEICDIKFSAYPHGGFVLHLADAEGFAKIKVDDDYLKLLKAIQEADIHNLLLRSMGALHPGIAHIFQQDLVKTQAMNSRAGYLAAEGVETNCNSCTQGSAVMCGRDEYIYNNVLLPNGDVVLCCQDFGMKHVLGNLLENSYEDMIPKPLSVFELCKKCHNAIRLPINFPQFVFNKL